MIVSLIYSEFSVRLVLSLHCLYLRFVFSYYLFYLIFYYFRYYIWFLFGILIYLSYIYTYIYVYFIYLYIYIYIYTYIYLYMYLYISYGIILSHSHPLHQISSQDYHTSASNSNQILPWNHHNYKAK